ncbi:Senescence-specific cysteine protease SAG12 [Linum grandiflorum]
MKKALVGYVLLTATIILRVPSLTARSTTYMEERHNKWMTKHGRTYKNRDEHLSRFQIYQSNVRLIQHVNSLNLSYKLTDNKFADLTNDEFKSTYLGLLPMPRRSSMVQKHADFSCDDLPEKVDWRKKGAVTEVKEQLCEDCWAFATVAAVESFHKIKTGKLTTLSEQELVDCVVGDGCKGGDMVEAYEFIKNIGGLTTNHSYPYKGRDGVCHKKRLKHRAAKINGYEVLRTDNETILRASVAKQPVTVAIDASDIQLYSKGIFTGSCRSNLNHGVEAVGYAAKGGKKYWIAKNSWGKHWGEAGYIRIQRDVKDKGGKCGIAMEISFPV